jgi:isopenicillin-N epimerase
MTTTSEPVRQPVPGGHPADAARADADWADADRADADWADARDRMMLARTVAYLNAGSAGPLPRAVFDRVTDLRRRLAEEPVDFLLGRVPALLWAAREGLATHLGGDPCRLMLTTNVTGAVNLVASGLSVQSPGEILLTDHEYQPMRWCWERAAARQGLTLRLLRLLPDPSGPEEIVEAARAAIGARTRLLFFSHVVSATGLVMPVRELCEMAAERGVVTVVDGAHGPAFTDLDLGRIPCDYYAGSGHKWLLAPTGTGFLHCGPGALERLRPMQVSWGHQPPDDAPPDRRDRFGSTPRLRRFEVEGTRDICPWLALPEAIGFQAGIGPARMRTRMRQLAGQVRDRLTGRHGLEPVTPVHEALSGGMVAFALPAGTDATGLGAELRNRFAVDVAVVARPQRPLIRVSTHFFNTGDDVERLAEALDQLVGRQPPSAGSYGGRSLRERSRRA